MSASDTGEEAIINSVKSVSRAGKKLENRFIVKWTKDDLIKEIKVRRPRSVKFLGFFVEHTQ
jgi:hypothetical protein